MNPNQPLIDKRGQCVVALAGGGSQVVGELLRHGGMSGFLMRAHVLQKNEFTDEYIGRKPDRYVSNETARALAMRAYTEARRFPSEGPYFGLGVTSSLVKPDGEREGRRHEVHVSLQKPSYTCTASFTLNAPRSRVGEESLASLIIQRYVWLGAEVWPVDVPLAEEDAAEYSLAIAKPEWHELVHGPRRVCGPEASRYVMPSSCNPPTDGHAGMMEWVEQNLGYPVDIELCVRNADKPPLDYVSIRDRVKWVEEKFGLNPCFGDLQLSNTPTFAEKSKAFDRGTVFVVGSDTINRVSDPKYYDGPEGLASAIATFKENRTGFLVFERPGHPVNVVQGLKELCRVVGEADGYVSSTVSSTRLRKEASRGNV